MKRTHKEYQESYPRPMARGNTETQKRQGAHFSTIIPVHQFHYYEEVMPIQFGGQISNCRISWLNKDGKGHFVLTKDLEGHPTDISALDGFASHPIPHFVKIEGIFSFQRSTSIVYEYMPVSLAEFSGHPSLRDRHLAAILAQVCDSWSGIAKPPNTAHRRF